MIPKIIHYFWFGKKVPPKKERECIESWKKFCPDYEIKFWNESNYDVTQNAYTREAYEAGKFGFAVDYPRLDIIYRYGGIYLDTDVEVIRNLDDLLEHKAFAGFEHDGDVGLGLAFGAEKGSPIIKRLMQWYETNHFLNEDGTLNLTPSSRMSTTTLEEMGMKSNCEYQIVRDGQDEMVIYPTEYFCPMDYEYGELLITENTYSIHHYAASWLPKGKALEHKFHLFIYRTFGKEKGEKILDFMDEVQDEKRDSSDRRKRKFRSGKRSS